MPLICSACGYGNVETNRYCEACGALLGDPAAPLVTPSPEVTASPGFGALPGTGEPEAAPGSVPVFQAPPTGGYSDPPPPPPSYGAPYGVTGSEGTAYQSGPGWDNYARYGYSPANVSWIGDGWNVLMQDMGQWIGYFFLLFIIQLVVSGLVSAPMIIATITENEDLIRASSALNNALSFVIQILTGIVTVGIASNVLRKLRFNDPLDIGQTFRDGFSRAVPAAIYTVVCSFIVLIGTCFCILPGIWLTAAVQLGYFRLADGSPDFWTAFQDGLAVAQSDVMGYFFFTILVSLFSLLGFLLCGVGALWTGPAAYLAWALCYRANFDRA